MVVLCLGVILTAMTINFFPDLLRMMRRNLDDVDGIGTYLVKGHSTLALDCLSISIYGNSSNIIIKTTSGLLTYKEKITLITTQTLYQIRPKREMETYWLRPKLGN